MRKLPVVFTVILLGLLCIPAAYADFTLPASLTVIEEEAFMGTAADSVSMQDAVVSIGDYSFSNIPTLQSVDIPQSVSFIGDNAFWTSERVTIRGAAGSYAEMWAENHGVAFVEAALIKHATSLGGIVLLLIWLMYVTVPMLSIPDYRLVNILKGQIQVRRRISELYPVLYDFP